jgi:hypothetical protein
MRSKHARNTRRVHETYLETCMPDDENANFVFNFFDSVLVLVITPAPIRFVKKSLVRVDQTHKIMPIKALVSL